MQNLQNLANLSSLNRAGGNGKQYILFDQFITALAAGAVNNTNAEPVGGARAVVDGASKITIADGVLDTATGSAANTDGIRYGSVARQAGRTVLVDTIMTANGGPMFGWDTGQTTVIQSGLGMTSATLLGVRSNAAQIVVGVVAVDTNYKLAVIMRATGCYYFIKGGAFTNWTLVYMDSLVNSAGFPGFTTGATNSVYKADNIRVPQALFLPTPACYDTFTRANGVLGNSEDVGPDSQSALVKAWVDTLGTWAIASNVAAASAVPAFATVDTGKADGLIEAELVRSGGVGGIVVRYADANNYIIAYHDGTNAKLDKVVGGVTTNVLTAVATYAANAKVRVICEGTAFRFYYNITKVGADATIADAALQSPTLHGLYTTNTGNTLNNFLMLPRGTANEYAALDSF